MGIGRSPPVFLNSRSPKAPRERSDYKLRATNTKHQHHLGNMYVKGCLPRGKLGNAIGSDDARVETL